MKMLKQTNLDIHLVNVIPLCKFDFGNDLEHLFKHLKFYGMKRQFAPAIT